MGTAKEFYIGLKPFILAAPVVYFARLLFPGFKWDFEYLVEAAQDTFNKHLPYMRAQVALDSDGYEKDKLNKVLDELGAPALSDMPLIEEMVENGLALNMSPEAIQERFVETERDLREGSHDLQYPWVLEVTEDGKFFDEDKALAEDLEKGYAHLKRMRKNPSEYTEEERKEQEEAVEEAFANLLGERMKEVPNVDEKELKKQEKKMEEAIAKLSK